MNKIKNYISKVDRLMVGEIIIIGLMILPVLLICWYSLPSADDFYNANLMRMNLENNGSWIKAASSIIIDFYKKGGGYVFSILFSCLFTPLSRGGIEDLRKVIFIINLFFYFSLLFFVMYVLRNVCKIRNKRIILLACILVLTSFINNDNNTEIRTWYTVVSAYVLIMAFMLWGIISLYKAIQKNSLCWTVIASTMGFLVSIGPLNITALNCGCYLLIGYIGIKIYKSKRAAVICFCSSLFGGIVNVLSPGNFIRHDQIAGSLGGHYAILGALKMAVYLGWSRIQYLLFHTPFILILLVLFIIAFKWINYSKGFKDSHPFRFLCVIFGGIILVNFPVCLGYSVSNGSFPSRCIWVEDCCIYFGFFAWIICVAGWAKNKFEIKFSKEVLMCIFVSGLFFICNLGSTKSLDDYPTVQIIKQLGNGQIAEYAKFWEEIFEEIVTSEEEEVIIMREELKTNQLVYPPAIMSDSESWVNEVTAGYYGKHKICLIINKDG